jgi:DNA replication protein DnaC
MLLELARCEFVVARENIIAPGNSGTGKTHIALALGLAACQRGFSVAFITAASLASQLMASSEKRSMWGIDRREKARRTPPPAAAANIGRRAAPDRRW